MMANNSSFLQNVREDDFVEYFVFSSTKDNVDTNVSLFGLLKEINKFVEEFSEYIWHRDKFKLFPRTSDADNKEECLPPHLYGITHYGDNIEDEWFIVFLLQRITEKIEGTIARIVDADGEFLLIEAADFLPSWANPDTCEKRVYLYRGLVHIIPMANNEQVDIKNALNVINGCLQKTQASGDIQSCISNKIQGYPEKIKDSLHRTTAYLPVGVASVLKCQPDLIAAAIRSFCNRDSIDMKACRAMKYFPPENRVNTSVLFTKCLYAMLTHSKYVPDKITGWNLPSLHSSQYKAQLLGAKIACGFEILVAQTKHSEDVECDRGWYLFLKSLKEKNYFHGLLEHSQDYNIFLNKAKEFYEDHRDTIHCAPNAGEKVVELMGTLDISADDLKKMESNLPEDDDESWLNIDPDELDKMLQEKYGRKQMFAVNGNTDASSFSAKITTFLNHVSDVEGAEFPNNADTIPTDSPVRPPRGIKRSEKSIVSFSADTKNENKNTNKMNFDPSSFSCAVQNILDFVIPDDNTWDLESDSDMSDYAEDRDITVENSAKAKSKLQQYMKEMDKELSSTTIGQSFSNNSGNNDTFDDIENFEPVDIDMNALKNILESYQSQMGEAGPASNMLGPMGIHLERDS